MGKERKSLGAVAVVALAAILLSAIAFDVDVDAAKGGNGKGKGNERTVAALTVSPNPVPYGTDITISGAGFAPGQTVLINTSHFNPEVAADADGNFSFVYDYLYGVGNASVQAWVMDGNTWVMVASASFTVVQ